MSKMMGLNSGPKARSVRSLPLKDWPAADRNAWEAACQQAHRLTRGGAASHLAEVTRADLARRYGYFLDFLARSVRLDATAPPATLVTPDSINAFIKELEARVSSVTVSQTIYKVRRAAECIAPGLRFGWLAEIGKDLALLERPKDKFDRIVPTERLTEAGLSLIEEAEADTSSPLLRRALLGRNGLMISLLALCPVRLKNFAALEIGQSFVMLETAWWMVLSKTKGGRPDNRPVPTFLTPFINRYLEVYRPILLRASSSLEVPRGIEEISFHESSHVSLDRSRSALWISRLGDPLSYDSVAQAITKTTQMTVGVPVSPHLFRSCCATSAALHAPQSPHLASALLQHADPRVKEEHYVRASSLSVARDFSAIVRRMR
jgi:integrase